MHSFDSTFHLKLLNEIAGVEADAIKSMTERVSKDPNDYPYHVGIIHGLRLVRTLCERVQAEMNKQT